MYVNLDGECEQIEYAAPPDDPSVTPLYTAPRQWVGLTMADMAELRQGGWHNISDERFRVIEAKIKEKNA
jgi:hypothetical protein